MKEARIAVVNGNTLKKHIYIYIYTHTHTHTRTKKKKERKKRTDFVRARTRNYSARSYSPWENRRIPKDIEYPAFCRGKEKEGKKKKDTRKMADEMQIYSLHGEVNGAKVCRRSVSVSDRWSHVYARRRNSRWRWITWPGFKARSPPSRVTLTRRVLTPPPLSSSSLQVSHYIRILDRCDARACCPKYPRFDDRSRVAPQVRLRLTRTWCVLLW